MTEPQIVDAVLPNGTVIGIRALEVPVSEAETHAETGTEADAQTGAGTPGARRLRATGRLLDSRFDLDEVRDAMSGLTELVKDALVRAAPDKASVEFGMELMVKEGRLTALLVSGGAKASFTITMEWERDKTT